MKTKNILLATLTPTGLLPVNMMMIMKRRIMTMSIERLPHKYPIGSTCRIGWQIGTIIFRIGLYHLIWWNETSVRPV